MKLGKLLCNGTIRALFSEENFKITDFNDRFGSKGKIKSLHEEPSSNKQLGSWINFSSPNKYVIPSILVLSWAFLPSECYHFVCALILPRTK